MSHRLRRAIDGPPPSGRMTASALGLCAVLGLLAGCQTPQLAGEQFGITVRAVSDGDFVLQEPDLAVSRGMIHVRGRICVPSGAAPPFPAHILIAGYDAAHQEMFRRVATTPSPRAGRQDLCRRYAATLAGVRMPAEIEVRVIAPAGTAAPARLIPHGGTAPP